MAKAKTLPKAKTKLPPAKVKAKTKPKAKPARNLDPLYELWVATPPSVFVKLGSIAVHADELLSPGGHAFDNAVLQQLLADPEVRAWVEAQTKKGLLPVKRERPPEPPKEEAKPKTCLANNFKDVRLIGDCGVFTLEYTPLCTHGKPQELSLDADSEAEARHEASVILECKEEELPETEWR